MPITYTNRKGLTYTLCRGTTKTGKPRYYFAREPKDEPVEQIPDGYTISESVNGIVSLSKAQPSQLRASEIDVVKAALARHPKKGNYRINVRPRRIEIYELVGPDSERLLSIMGESAPLFSGMADQVRAEIERYGQFTPVLRFTLIDADQRAFEAERMCYLGSIDDFIYIGYGALHQLAKRMIPALGTDEFFELI